MTSDTGTPGDDDPLVRSLGLRLLLVIHIEEPAGQADVVVLMAAMHEEK